MAGVQSGPVFLGNNARTHTQDLSTKSQAESEVETEKRLGQKEARGVFCCETLFLSGSTHR